MELCAQRYSSGGQSVEKHVIREGINIIAQPPPIFILYTKSLTSRLNVVGVD